MPIYEVTSKPVDGAKTFTGDDGSEREYLRITTGEFEDEAEAKVRVNDLMARRVEGAQALKNDPDADDPHENEHRLYKVTKVREV
jgi:hypothetical protein